MAALENKIDFAIAFEVNNANPNGDPLNGNRPRTTSEGLGEVSDVRLEEEDPQPSAGCRRISLCTV